MSPDKRVFVSLGIVGGVVVSFLLVCGFGLVFVVNTIQEKADSEDAMLQLRAAQVAAKQADAINLDDSPPPTVEKPAVVAPQAGETTDGNKFIRPDGEIINFDPKTLKFATSIIAEFDENKNGIWDGAEVSAALDELAWLKPTTDINSDGEIGRKELAAFLTVDRR